MRQTTEPSSRVTSTRSLPVSRSTEKQPSVGALALSWLQTRSMQLTRMLPVNADEPALAA